MATPWIWIGLLGVGALALAAGDDKRPSCIPKASRELAKLGLALPDAQLLAFADQLDALGFSEAAACTRLRLTQQQPSDKCERLVRRAFQKELAFTPPATLRAFRDMLLVNNQPEAAACLDGILAERQARRI